MLRTRYILTPSMPSASSSTAMSSKHGRRRGRSISCSTVAGFAVMTIAAAPTAKAFHASPAAPTSWALKRTQYHASSLLNNMMTGPKRTVKGGNTPENSSCHTVTRSIRRLRVRQGELAARGIADGESESGVQYTRADLDVYSAPWGITLHYSGTMNTYRIEAHRENGEVAGYTTGFYVGDYLHLDKVQIQRKASAYEPGAPNAPIPGTRVLPWAEKTGNLFQLGAVLGCAAVRYGYDRGARRVELLAIRENEKQHSRLVRYYRIAGFHAVREVGEDLGSLRDRLLWGAEGTLMVAQVEEFMKRWTPIILDAVPSNSKAVATTSSAAGPGSLTTLQP